MLVCLLPARAEKRVALVIGNSSYQNVAQLPNPVNDATAVVALLRAAKFDVVEPRRDLGISGLRRAIGDFADTAADADVAIVFFAGHGIEIDGMNFLIPVDARLARDFDVEDEAVSLDRVLKAIEPARRLRLVILDACRDNPFVGKMQRGSASRSIGRGLGRVEPTTSNTLVAFAAKAGSTAKDGDGANSPFTAALVKHLATPGLDVRLAFGMVRDEVLASTGWRQEPYVYGSLGGRPVSIVDGGTPSSSDAAAAWGAVKETTSVAVLEDFERRYGDTIYGTLARVRLEELKKTLTASGQKPLSAVTALATPESAKPAPALGQASPPVLQQTLGLSLASLTSELRQRYKIKDIVNGVVITGVDVNSAAAEKRLNAGDVIVEVAGEPVGSAADVQKRIDQVKKDGKKSALLLVANAEGDLRFVALTLESLSTAQNTIVAAVVPPVKPGVATDPCGSPVALASLSRRGAQPLSTAEECGLKPKDVFKECEMCPEMVVIPAGEFMMGSPETEKGRLDTEGPQHRVKIGKTFAVARVHVMVAQFSAFVAATGHDAGSSCHTWNIAEKKWEEQNGRSWRSPGFAQDGSHPVVCLSWHDAKEYLAWLTKTTGKSYRLLTEAEWEYAARGGMKTRYFFGDDEKDLCRYGNGGASDVAPCSDGYGYTAPAGSFAPNALGLYDMHGNAWQWVEDCWHENYKGAPTDGSAWTGGKCDNRVVLRGGSWVNSPRGLRSAIRTMDNPGTRLNVFGFRLARTLFTP